MRSRIWSMIVAVSLACAVVVEAQEAVPASLPSDVVAERGETVTIEVAIGAVAGVESIDFRLGFDTAVLDIADVRPGALLADATQFLANPDDDGGRVIVGSFFIESTTLDGGTLIEIDFSIDTDAPEGPTELDLVSLSLNEDGIPVDASDGLLTVVVPRIEVTPDPLDLGAVPVDDSATGTVTIRSAGGAPLEIIDVQLAAGSSPAFSISSDPGAVELPPGQTAAVEVTFAPLAAGPVEGALEIRSDDPSRGTVRVELRGAGTVPEIAVEPGALDFGEVVVGDVGMLDLTVSNEGAAPLVIASVELTPASSDDFSFELPGPLPLSIPAAGAEVVAVTYEPSAPGEATGVLRISSNDGTAPEVTIDLSGTGLPAGTPFRRADANADGAVNISDPQFTLNFLFLGGPTPPCMDAADSNDDGAVNISDPQFTLNFLFLGGPPPRDPGSESCGLDPTDDGLECDAYTNC